MSGTYGKLLLNRMHNVCFLSHILQSRLRNPLTNVACLIGQISVKEFLRCFEVDQNNSLGIYDNHQFWRNLLSLILKP